MLGVDPGTAVTGYGVVEPAEGHLGHLVECGVIRTESHAPLPQRLGTIYDDVTQLIERHRPVALALESVFHAKNVRTTVTLGQARGVILLAAERRGLRIAEFPPATVKKSIVGTGRAAKPQVGFMVQKLLKLAAPPTPDDAADGVALALTYLIVGGDRL